MAAGSLLTLLDDIATVLDDIAILSKVAAKKTAGVLGDDLALNAEQVSGVKADRELPVVWAVAKGSFLNKLILVPSALLISSFIPALITYLLIIGGLYLCYEGCEKLWHAWHTKQTSDQSEVQALANLSKINKVTAEELVALEKDKIKGAIRTDFVLSAEIIVIILGTLQATSMSNQIIVLSSLALLFTVGVYGFVAMIVKMDDAGLWLLRKSLTGSWDATQRALGRGLLIFAPFLMKTLSIVGTIAMFLVGGGILTHNIIYLHHIQQAINQQLINVTEWINIFTAILIDGFAGFLAGSATLIVVNLFSRLRKKS